MAYTDNMGFYTITGLPSDTYKIQFTSEVSGYAGEWYDNKADYASATAVSVTAGHTTTGIDAVLNPWGGISGTVTGTGGVGLDWAEVTACTLDRL